MNQELIAQLDDVLKNEPVNRHSYFQLKYFLIGKEPTIQSKMWQCIKELKTRRDSLNALELEIEETKDKQSLLNISVEKLQIELGKAEVLDLDPKTLELYKRELEVKIRQLNRQINATVISCKELEERQKWIREECIFFLETFKNLSKIEPLRNYDDFDAQKQYWTERLGQKMNLKFLTSGQLDSDLVETILALPDEMAVKQQMIAMLNARTSNINKAWNESKKSIEKQ
jgi:hypothetical protein